MKNKMECLSCLIDMTRIGSLLSRKFDGSLNGLGWNDFIILYHLSLAPEMKLRRIDLAEKVGLTASGVTRMLLPMEKIGLISKESNPQDARVSFVVLAPGGKRKLEEGMERALLVASEIFPTNTPGGVIEFSAMLKSIGGAILWR